MTTMRLALSALVPGAWTAYATAYGFLDTVGPADSFGNPSGDPTSQTEVAVAAGVVSLPDAAADGVSEQQTFDDLQFGGTQLQSPDGLVTVRSYTLLYGLLTGAVPGTLQIITADGPWNVIKDIAVSTLSSQALAINNFVDVALDIGSDPVAHAIDIEAAKRGSVSAGDGNENIGIRYLSNEYSWSNSFDMTLGNGNNNVSIAPLDADTASLLPTLTPMQFNTAPQKTLANISVGNGNDTITTNACSAAIHLGNGNDSVTVFGGNDEVWAGGGTDMIAIESQRGNGPHAADPSTDLVHPGAGWSQVYLLDDNPADMPETTVDVDAPRARASDGAATIFYGHFTSGFSYGPFAGGDWSDLQIDLQGFAAGSRISLQAVPYQGYSALAIQDAASNLVRTIDLIGGTPTLGQLHINFS